MLRLIVLLLLLANGLFFAWSHELLRGLGFGPTLQGEPQRLAQQINPQEVVLLKPAEYQRMEEQLKAEQAPAECLQSGPLDAEQVAALRPLLAQSLPANSWDLQETPIAARWIVYMGKYANAEALAKKRAEALALNIKTESLQNTSLEPGFSLGGFEDKADADSALQRMSARGLHTARVVQERAPGTAYQLRLPGVSAALKPKLAPLGAALGGKALHACN
jgi:hypothetical protein